jgi:hypothetical protein
LAKRTSNFLVPPLLINVACEVRTRGWFYSFRWSPTTGRPQVCPLSGRR